jgi:predicted nucleic acid-binding protein
LHCSTPPTHWPLAPARWVEELRRDGVELVILDVLVNETVSVLCRRSRERRNDPPDVHAVLAIVRRWSENGNIRWVGGDIERLMPIILDVVGETGGRLNFNDALLVALQREGSIGEVASFDAGFDVVPDFTRVSGQ